MFFHYLKFELTKRNQRWWVWLLVAILTGIGVTGNFQQKVAQNEFIQKYRQELIHQGASQANGPTALKIELQQLNRSPAAYNHWFAAELPVLSGQRPATNNNAGANYRIAVLNGSAKPDYLDAVNRTEHQNELLAQHKLSSYYPQGLLFTDQELQTMPAETAKLVREWFPTFYVRGFDYLQYLFQQNIPFYLLLIGIIVSGGLFAKELAHQRAHANWLRLQGEGWGTQIAVQFLTIGLTTVEIVLLPLLLTTLVTGCLNGFGSLRFPVISVTYQNALNSFAEDFTTSGQLIFHSIALLLLLIALVTAFNIVTALIAKNAWITTTIVLLVTASALIMPPVPWLPLSFFNVWKIASGTIAQSTALPEMQLGSGIQVIMVWLLGLLAAAAIGSLNFTHHSSFKASSKADAAENERSY